MSNVRAIFVSDVHLQARAPVARSGEPDWFAAMAKPLDQIKAIAKANDDPPVIYAGDIFDRWHAGPEVINFALEHLPRGYAVPGQHDLPNHSYYEIKRSAYWTLVEAGLLRNLPYNCDTYPNEDDGLALYGFPWNDVVRPLPPAPGKIKIAVIHKFIWCKGTGYPGASNDMRLAGYKKALGGYDVAHFGDNHKGFLQHPKNGPWVCNSGTLMRRKIDERNYRPTVGLLLDDGKVVRHKLDISDEVFAEVTEAEELVNKLLDMTSFVDELRSLEADNALDFAAVLKRFLRDNDIPEKVIKIILQAQDGR